MEEDLINLTPHEVRLVGEDGKTAMVFPSQGAIRLLEERERVDTLSLEDGEVPIFKKRFSGGADLPPEKAGTLYIVSLPIAQAYPGRRDFLVPDQLVRDKEGRVVGAKALATLGGGQDD